MARTIAIWIFGLLASAVIGAWINALVNEYTHSYTPDGFGVIGGMCAFACVRLWLASPQKNSN
jgi:hypothetical protein